ncbi:uncharacterized protein LOC143582591 [Bidens hawaiensis]|uniref:uncharacterized protein LOC143582591 n=1 Tax=Bidens hawaiensis TaxID=980011 RepID=UPI00404924F8
MDGALSRKGSGAGLRLLNPEGLEFTYAIRLDFKSINNEAEYEAFLARLHIAKKLGIRHLEAHVDSMLLWDKSMGYIVGPGFLILVDKLFLATPTYALSKLASTSFEHLVKEVRIEVLEEPSVPQHQVLVIQTSPTSWMTQIKAYLSTGMLPEGNVAAQKICHKALQYQLLDGILYQRSFLGHFFDVLSRKMPTI